MQNSASDQLFNVRVVRTPLEVTGSQPLTAHGDDGHAYRVDEGDAKSVDDVPIGPRGLLRLRDAAQEQRGGSRLQIGHSPTTQAGSSSCPPPACPMILVRQHHGQMCVVDTTSAAVTTSVSCETGPEVSVAQVVSTPRFMYARLESHPQRGGDALDADHNVYVFDLIQPREHPIVLRHHTGRVTAIAAHPGSNALLATAGADFVVCVWDVAVSSAAPLCALPSRATGIISALCWCGCRLVGGGATVPVSVWDYQANDTARASATPASELRLVAQAPVDTSAAVTAMRIIPSPSSGDSVLPTVFVGCTDGFVRKWCDKRATRRPSVSSGGQTTSPLQYTVDVQAKVHRATVTQLLVEEDGALVISASPYGGISFFHLPTGRQQTLLEDSGVTAVVVDTANRIALAGLADGRVCSLHYASFTAVSVAASPTGTRPAVNLAWCCRPGLSAITGISLAVSAGNVWEQLTFTCADGTLYLLTMVPSRSRKSFHYTTAGSAEAAASLHPSGDVRSVVPVEQSGIHAAVVYNDNRPVELVSTSSKTGNASSAKHTVRYRVLYTGAVEHCAADGSRAAAARQTSFFLTDSSVASQPQPANFPACVAAEFSAERKCLLLLYANGLLQLLDTSSFFVAARYWLSGNVARVVASPSCVSIAETSKDSEPWTIPYHSCVPAFNRAV